MDSGANTRQARRQTRPGVESLEVREVLSTSAGALGALTPGLVVTSPLKQVHYSVGAANVVGQLFRVHSGISDD